MALIKRSGKIVSISDHTTHDYFVGADVLDINLESEGKIILARIIPHHGFQPALENKYTDYPGEYWLSLDKTSHRRMPNQNNDDPFITPIQGNETKVCGDNIRVQAAIGDEVVIYWDYERFRAEIITPAVDRSKLIPLKIESTGTRPFSISDIFDSLEG